VLGGKVGVRDNVSIGRGAALAASSAVGTDVPEGARWGGTPARPIKEWLRESFVLRRLTLRRSNAEEDEKTPDDNKGDAADER
jgi:UDP-3-O-[3-hydroxymyristoyl] glucosamine N-acyltransferase